MSSDFSADQRDEFEKMSDLLHKAEPLHEDLQDSLTEGGLSGHMISNFLLHTPIYTPQLNALYNKQYQVRKEHYEQQLMDGNFQSALSIVERPYRFENLLSFCHDYGLSCGSDEFWDLFWYCWTDTENFYQNRDIVRLLLLAATKAGSVKHSWEVSEEEDTQERKVFESLPDQVAIYRGQTLGDPMGYCWTLSPTRANWFARRSKYYDVDNRGETGVYRVVVSRECVLTFLNGRGEMEVAVDPSCLSVEPEKYSFEFPEHLQEHVKAASIACHSDTKVHGVDHWYCVYRNAMAICDRYEEADREVCELFAVFHDCCRVSDGKDNQHGKRAYDFLKERRDRFSIDDRRFGVLLNAVKYHNTVKYTDDPTTAACWDADRLELSRVGKVPDKKYFNTPVGYSLLWTL